MADLNDDIARYLSGRMSPAEMHALEKRALDDPFIADALDGGETIPEAVFSDDVSGLQHLISERKRATATGALPEEVVSGRGKQVSMWSWPTRIAAGLLLVASAGVVLFFISDKRADHLALNTTSKSVPPSSPSSTEPATDSVLSEKVQSSADAAGDPAAALKRRSASEALPDNKQAAAAPTPTVEPALREQLATIPSVKDAGPRKGETIPDGSNVAANDLTKEETDGASAGRALAGRTAGVQLNSAKPQAAKSAETPAEILTEAEVAKADQSERIAANDSRADKDNSQTEIADTRQQVDAKRAYKVKEDQAGQAASKKEGLSKIQPAPAVVPGEATDARQVFSGKVVDSDGTGIPGVNVVIKGTNTGTVTDIEGNYQLSVPDLKPTLVFTFIGYANLEQEADASKPATVALEEDLTQLSEVVVAGYGAQRTGDPIAPTFDFANPSGGKRAFKQYLEKNLQYPREALLNQVEGRVTIQFSVETTGSLSDFRVLKGIGNGCDEEVIRLIKSGPKWNPTKRDETAEKSTIKVRMRFQLPKEKKK